MTLKPSQGHQTYNDNVDPKQGYNYSRFEKSLMVSEKKPMSKVFFFQIRKCQLSLLNICENQQ